MQAQAVELVVHATPNPVAYKFVSSREFLPEGQAEWTRATLPAGYPLLDALFAHPEVVRVYAAGYSLTIVRADDADWGTLTLPIRRAIYQALVGSPEPLLPEGQVPAMPPVPMAEFFRTRILPATGQDGGAIWLASLDGDTVQVHTAGACTRCPYLPQTLEQGVLGPLNAQHPDITKVKVVPVGEKR